VLVGDSVGMVLHGLPVASSRSRWEMIDPQRSSRAARAIAVRMLVIDMPLAVMNKAPAPSLLENAARFECRETGAGAVKLEGGRG